MSNACRVVIALLALCSCLSDLPAQEMPQPGPEHQKLKELQGTWDAVVKFGETETKATMVWTMDVGGLWLVGDFQTDSEADPFKGKGFDGYDPVKQKYVAVWIDSMSTSPMISEGTYDATGKVLTMHGSGPGMDGQPAKFRLTTEHQDHDTILWSMYNVGADGNESKILSITYTRRK